MEEKELWMNKLKEKLEDYSEPIPASGWEQLEKELMPPVERKIYPYRKWMMAAAAVILLALVSSVSLYFLGTPAADEIRHTQTPALASVPDALPAVQQPDAQGATADPVYVCSLLLPVSIWWRAGLNSLISSNTRSVSWKSFSTSSFQRPPLLSIHT